MSLGDRAISASRQFSPELSGFANVLDWRVSVECPHVTNVKIPGGRGLMPEMAAMISQVANVKVSPVIGGGLSCGPTL
jgi:hypothetical protein